MLVLVVAAVAETETDFAQLSWLPQGSFVPVVAENADRVHQTTGLVVALVAKLVACDSNAACSVYSLSFEYSANFACSVYFDNSGCFGYSVNSANSVNSVYFVYSVCFVRVTSVARGPRESR